MTPTTTTTSTTIETIWTSAKEEFSARVGCGYGCMLLGLVLAHPLHDEIHTSFHCIPGAWIHGPSGTGKTELGATVAALYGVEHRPLRDPSTYKAMIAAIASSHIAPAHFDGVDTSTPGALALLREPYTRTSGSTLLHPPLITAENSCPDSATASRYLHFATKRLDPFTDSWDRLQESRRHFQAVTRTLLEHRSIWLKLAISSIESILAINPITFARLQVNTSIAAGVFIAADYILSGGADMTQGERDALDWIRAKARNLNPFQIR